MQINEPQDNPTEATMSDTATPRYGYDPKVAFAATRAGAERRARETAAAATFDERRTRPAPHPLRRLADRLAMSPHWRTSERSETRH